MLNRFKVLVVNEPHRAALFAKKTFTEARAWFFGGSYPTQRLARFPYKRMALEFSYGKRALPPPPKDDSLLSEFIDRICGDPQPEVQGWRPFVQGYLDAYKPSKPALLWTQPTSHSVLGYPRRTGGMAEAVADLTCIGYLLQFPDGKDRFGGSTQFPHPHFDQNTYRRAIAGSDENAALAAADRAAAVQAKHRVALRHAVHWVLQKMEYIPVLPLYAEERGLKVRYPTTTLVAANLVYQLFRRAVDSYLIRDRRVSASMGGPLDIDLSRTHGPWYSVDMTKATDHHPFWLTRTVYEEVLKRDARLAEWEPYMAKLFGPHRILEGQSGEFEHKHFRAFLPELGNTRRCKKDGPEWSAARAFFDHYEAYLTGLNDRPGRLSRRGAMMGNASSFPVLPLVSIYAAREAKRHRLKACGDDALIPRMGVKRRAVFDETARSLGATPSDHAGFSHQDWGLYCEDPYYKGKRVAVLPISIWNAPPGGSKSSTTWYNQNRSALDFQAERGASLKRGLHRFSPHRRSAEAAFHLGLPVREVEAYGGICHPGFPHTSLTAHDPWLSKLSSLTISDLGVGTGLSPLPSGQSHGVRRLGRAWIESMLQEAREIRYLSWYLAEHPEAAGDIELAPLRIVETPTRTVSKHQSAITTTRKGSMAPGQSEERENLTLQQAVGRVTASISTWELFWEPPLSSMDLKTPSVRMTCDKFLRKVTATGTNWVLPGSYQKVVADLEAKRRFVPVPLCYITECGVPKKLRDREYGLESSSLTVSTTATMEPWVRTVEEV
jgi:hypothetical protein